MSKRRRMLRKSRCSRSDEHRRCLTCTQKTCSVDDCPAGHRKRIMELYSKTYHFTHLMRDIDVFCSVQCEVRWRLSETTDRDRWRKDTWGN